VRGELLALPPRALRGHRAGWLALAVFAFIETGLGRSLIHGDEELLFLAVLAAGLVWEATWYAARRTNAVLPRST
jgi:hypothetical protein